MENSEYPSLPDQGKNLAQFTFDVVKSVMKNQESLFVSADVREKRLETCKKCEYYDDRQVRCRHCGCFLEHKVKFSIDSCPLGKWKESEMDWLNGGFDQVVEDIKKPELDPEDSVHPLFPLEAQLGEEYTWRGHTWKWNGQLWDYVASVQE